MSQEATGVAGAGRADAAEGDGVIRDKVYVPGLVAAPVWRAPESSGGYLRSPGDRRWACLELDQAAGRAIAFIDMKGPMARFRMMEGDHRFEIHACKATRDPESGSWNYAYDGRDPNRFLNVIREQEGVNVKGDSWVYPGSFTFDGEHVDVKLELFMESVLKGMRARSRTPETVPVGYLTYQAPRGKRPLLTQPGGRRARAAARPLPVDGGTAYEPEDGGPLPAREAANLEERRDVRDEDVTPPARGEGDIPGYAIALMDAVRQLSREVAALKAADAGEAVPAGHLEPDEQDM